MRLPKTLQSRLILLVWGSVVAAVAFEFLKIALGLPWVIGASVAGALIWVARRQERRRRRRVAWVRQRRLDSEVETTDQMTGTAFELLVQRLLARDGWEAAVVGGAGDLGADVVAMKDGRRLVVQCKRYRADRAVQSGEMQKFVGTARPHHHADDAWFVTTSRFTPAAADYGQAHRIRLFDRDQLAQWMAGD